MITVMNASATHPPSQDESAAVAPRILASIVAEGQTAPRPVMHLGVTDGARAAAVETTPEYALGVCRLDGVYWIPVGPLDLPHIVTERVLLAGLSALAMRYVREAQVQIGDAVLVFGADPWSLLLLQWARLQGAAPLVLARCGPDPRFEHVSLAGLDAELANPAPGDLARAVKLTHRDAGFAIAIDAVASEQSMSQALSTLRDGGRYVLAAIDPQPRVVINAYPDLHRRDLEMVSALLPATASDFAQMFRFSLQLAGKGRLQLDGLLGRWGGWTLIASKKMSETR